MSSLEKTSSLEKISSSEKMPSQKMNEARPNAEGLNRREFARELSGIAAAGAALSALAAKPAAAQNGYSAAAGSTEKIPLDLAEYSYFWVGVERAEMARGTVANGKQMYVEYAVPTQLRHPYPIVLVHGGGGQGLDWMGTPDGRPGWFSHLLAEGYAVYVVDRPGHGRSPYHPEVMGGWPARHLALEAMSGRFTPPNATTQGASEYQKKYHNQWPGTGLVGSQDLAQLVSSQGGAYVQAGTQSAAVAHQAWRERGAMLLDKIGPAIIMTHSQSGPIQIRSSLLGSALRGSSFETLSRETIDRRPGPPLALSLAE